MTGRAGTIAWVGTLVGLATAVAVAIPATAAVRLPLVLLFACLGPGCAVVAHLRRTDLVSATALAVVASLTIFVGAAAVMAWASWWHPRDSVLALAGLTTLSCLVALGLGALRTRGRLGATHRSTA